MPITIGVRPGVTNRPARAPSARPLWGPNHNRRAHRGHKPTPARPLWSTQRPPRQSQRHSATHTTPSPPITMAQRYQQGELPNNHNGTALPTGRPPNQSQMAQSQPRDTPTTTRPPPIPTPQRGETATKQLQYRPILTPHIASGTSRSCASVRERSYAVSFLKSEGTRSRPRPRNQKQETFATHSGKTKISLIFISSIKQYYLSFILICYLHVRVELLYLCMGSCSLYRRVAFIFLNASDRFPPFPSLSSSVVFISYICLDFVLIHTLWTLLLLAFSIRLWLLC